MLRILNNWIHIRIRYFAGSGPSSRPIFTFKDKKSKKKHIYKVLIYFFIQFFIFTFLGPCWLVKKSTIRVKVIFPALGCLLYCTKSLSIVSMKHYMIISSITYCVEVQPELLWTVLHLLPPLPGPWGQLSSWPDDPGQSISSPCSLQLYRLCHVCWMVDNVWRHSLDMRLNCTRRFS
jgi:hypothetical protein